MKTRKLGYSDLHLTPIGLGTWAMGGGDWKFGWGDQDDAASIASVHQALDAGVNWIDTAAIYGHGHAERVVGKAIQDRRDDVLIATKCGRVWEGESREIGKSLRRESVHREVDVSLQRLGIDCIDLYQIHWPEPDEEIEEGWGAVAELVEAGKIRYAGVSNFNMEQLKRIQPIHPVTSLQPPYSMLRREVEEEVLPYCRENQIGIVAYSPMQAGLLTGRFSKERVQNLPANDWRKANPFFTSPQLEANLSIIEQLRPVAAQMEITLPQLALAWVLRRSEMTAAIAGARRPEQILETVKAGEIVIPDELLLKIERMLSA
ncbi:MAG: aldo/keto reductase [Verrucomicrobia bacterium]|jgi:aryl-alcohol dehydrogenase-like predicted oxidoreductase|nr:aldo/keto reductase [Verrucomicrobiota bacterium]MBT4274219.1 aldo/keto reductase [Verrucomicrobiota bacterium]MBT5061366.1 aldo/keto reductase [Verrucomicrobiota bacterium]MBT5479278.1 aldo/keto reductase [Verrucomicrobiota bacterium]MBT6239994.1 aldo/keto reductase [Verrucomicrobiota bacterium]